MAELDQTPSKSTSLSKSNAKKSTSNVTRGRRIGTSSSSSTNNQRKPVKIAPAPTISNIK